MQRYKESRIPDCLCPKSYITARTPFLILHAGVNQIKDDCLELYSYELKDRRTSHGEIFEASLEIKVKRGNHMKNIGTTIRYGKEGTKKSL